MAAEYKKDRHTKGVHCYNIILALQLTFEYPSHSVFVLRERFAANLIIINAECLLHTQVLVFPSVIICVGIRHLNPFCALYPAFADHEATTLY